MHSTVLRLAPLMFAVTTSACTRHEVIVKDRAADGEPIDTSEEHAEASPGNATSGTRLKLRTMATHDGARLPMGFFDSDRGEPCAFVPAADDASRCLPLAGWGTPYWGDPGCATTPLLHVSARCEPPTVVREELPHASDACSEAPTRYAVRQVGALYTGAVYVRDTAKRCVPSATAAADPTGPRYARVGAVIPPASFVAGEETHE